ncbi:hypothetical protein Brms1b_013229 [Colletotrichum noveboracense]|nr:hypothetical protein Brms1b_013229 [Colletotrichum noveboracense]
MDPTSQDPQDQQLGDHVEPTDDRLSAQPPYEDDGQDNLDGNGQVQPNVSDNAVFGPEQETRLLLFLKGLGNSNNIADGAVSNLVPISSNDAASEAAINDVHIETSLNIADDTAADATIRAMIDDPDVALRPDLEETLREEINVSSLEPPNPTALHIALAKGLNKIAEQLIGAGANVNALDENGVQPLQIACDNGNTDLIKLLLDNGATTRGPDRDGWCLLHYASYYDMDADLLERLIEVDRNNLNHKESCQGWTPINRAAWFGRQTVVEALLKARVDLGIADKNGWTPLMTAIEETNFQIFDKMVDHLAEIGSNDDDISKEVIDQRDDEGMTVLMTLCDADPTSASEDSLRNFLQKLRPNTDIIDNIEQTALNHVMALVKKSNSPYALNMALEMIKWWPEHFPPTYHPTGTHC